MIFESIPDIRVDKECSALLAAGHEVVFLVPTEDQSAPLLRSELRGGVAVDRVRIDSPAGQFVRNAIRSLTLYDGRMSEPIRRFIQRRRIEVLHVHDLWWVPVALREAARTGTPVVADLHENIPAAERAGRTRMPFLRRMASRVFRNYHVLRWHEARALRRCERVVVVVPEAAERLSSYGVDPSRVHVVSNTEDLTTFEPPSREEAEAASRRNDGSFVLSYIGGIGPHRGIDTLLLGMPKVLEVVPTCRLVVVGADPASRGEIEYLARRLDVSASVEIHGWQEFSTVRDFIVRSDICLVPHNDFEHTQTTIPHKLFQYMICGKPVLVSDCRPLRRVVLESGCGRVFEASNPRSFARVVADMYAQREDLAEMGARGRAAATGRYAWRHDAEELVLMYRDLLEAATG